MHGQGCESLSIDGCMVTDFEEGVSTGEMIAETRALVEAGVKCIGLAALDDQGIARSIKAVRR